ncbi:hypothetical protein H0H87_009720 [Tephrocybe sp. NHM501043]|nr:hypothetical protein H0H87_009720 [Tephrocybe sp. NHM501043]
MNWLGRNRPRLLDLLAVDTDPPKKPNVGAIVGGVIGGLAVLAILCFLILKRRRRIPDVEEGPKSPGWKETSGPDLKSQFSPDATNGGKLDRLRDALGRRAGLGKKAPLDNILPVYHVNLPAGSAESIDRPPTALPSHVPRYPSVLERGSRKRFSPPPPLEGYPDLSRVSLADSIQPTQSASTERTGRRVQLPPKALVVPTPGRPLPGLVVASAKSAGLHMPKSPSRRRSFFSKHPFKHPFIPVRSVDNTLRFPPSSPLHPGQYQPSRQHLETRMSEARSPRIESITSARSGSMSARPMTGKEITFVRRQPPPQLEDPGSSKQARLVEALQSAGIEIPRTPRTPRTPAQGPPRTALPPHTSRHPLRSAKFLPEPPTTSYI